MAAGEPSLSMFSRAAHHQRYFWGAIGLALAIKVVIALLLPVTGDEAYFVQYARNVDWGGFYDHPPMVGWLIWLTERIGTHPLLLRLPAIATGLVLALGLYVLLRPVDEAKARLVALIMLFSPVYLVGVLMTSDTGLLAFGFLSAVCLQLALRHERPTLFLLAGVLLGLAFLSKYFAVLLGVAYLALMPIAGRRHAWGFVLLILAALPFGLLNLAWNYCHCWNHIMFNLFNRTGGGEFSLVGVAVYALILVYLFALPAWYLLRDQRFLRGALRFRGVGALVLTGLIPLALFALLAPMVDIGLHWVLLFVPLVMAAGIMLSHADIAVSARFMGWFGLAHAVVVIALLTVPVQWFDGRDIARDAVFYLEPGAYTDALAEFDADVHATDSYSRAAVAGYYSGHHWSVFGTGSRHARQDDTLTDWREHDGARMLFFSRRHEIDTADLEPYFDAITVERVSVKGQEFEVALADGFDYATYHDEVLRDIRDRYYAIPPYLPVGGCPFLERYFDDGSS